MKKETVTSVGWSFSSTIVKQLLQFAISIILARLLTPEDFGLLGMTVIFTGFVTLFSDLGFNAALIQKKQIHRIQYSSIFWLNIVTGLCLMLLTMAAAPSIATFYVEPRLVSLANIVAVNHLITSFGLVQSAIINRQMNFRLLAAIEVAAMLISGIVAIILAFAGYGVYTLAWQMLIMTTVQVTIMWYKTNWYPALRFSWTDTKEFLGFSGNLLGFGVFNYWVRNADNLLIGKYVNPSGLGIYSRAYSTMLLPLYQVNSIISRVMFPALSKIQDDKLRIRSIYLRVISVIALITFPMMLGLFVVADKLVIVLFGLQWIETIPILRILSLVGLTQSIGTTTSWIYKSQGRTDWLFRWGVASGIVTLTAFAIGIQWGIIGVAIAYAIRNTALIYFNFSIPGKLIEMSFGNVVNAVAETLAQAIIMAALVWLVGLVLPTSWSMILSLIIQISFGVLVYGLLIHFSKLSAYHEVRTILYEQIKPLFSSVPYNVKL